MSIWVYVDRDDMSIWGMRNKHMGMWVSYQQDEEAQQLNQEKCTAVNDLSTNNYLLTLQYLCFVVFTGANVSSVNPMARFFRPQRNWASIMYLIKTKDGAECVKESNDVEEDEGGEDGTTETNLIPIAKHLKSSKCPKSAGPKNIRGILCVGAAGWKWLVLSGLEKPPLVTCSLHFRAPSPTKREKTEPRVESWSHSISEYFCVRGQSWGWAILSPSVIRIAHPN